MYSSSLFIIILWILSQYYSFPTSGVSATNSEEQHIGGNQTKHFENKTGFENITMPEFCNVEKIGFSYSISCVLEKYNVFSFTDFRNWSNETQTTSSISLSIRCNGGGLVQLLWPYRSYFLVSLKIDGCVLVDKYSGYNEGTTMLSIEDRLEAIDFTNCIERYDLMENMEALAKLSSMPEMECGPLNLRYNIQRNVTTDIYMGDEIQIWEVTNISDISDANMSSVEDEDTLISEGTNLFQETEFISPEIGTPSSAHNDEKIRQGIIVAALNPSHICMYKHWKYYEKTYTTGLSRFHLQALTRNSIFPQMKVLNFSHTVHYDMPAEILQWRKVFPVLETVDMSFNFISAFQFVDNFNADLPGGYINLQYNNISSLNIHEIESFQALKTTLIDVRNNPFNCECNIITTFNEFLRRHNGPLEGGLQQNYSYLWKLECKYPPKLAGRVISELTYAVICDSDVTMYVAQIAILSIIIIVLTIIIIVITKYRKDIRILVFTRLNIVLPCQPNEELDFFTQYDAFISYSSADAHWVHQTLASRLEKPESDNSFKLCLHHRDFSVGDYICDNIIASVEKSRHTVLVVSNNFLKSEWCVFEFREALYKSLVEKKKHMVIILLEDVSLTHVESDFRRCLQTMTHIKADDRLFWDRIQYALARKSGHGSTPTRQMSSKSQVVTKCSANPENSSPYIESSNGIIHV